MSSSLSRSFSDLKLEFDTKNHKTNFPCFLPVHTSVDKNVTIIKNGFRNEEYYKWQFLYGIVYSGMYAKDYIGTEINFPKGNKNSAPIKIDAAIFDDKDWFEYYKAYCETSDSHSIDWLRQHLIATIEFKNENAKNIESVWSKQLKSYLKESERNFCIGILYDTERLFLFKKTGNKYLRLNDEYNTKGEKSGSKELSLHLPDPYINIPSFDELLFLTTGKTIDRTKRNINDLGIISGIQSEQVNDAMSTILRTMDKQSMVNQTGYEILIQILALKIFDEKRNEKNPSLFLDFYITIEEQQYKDLADKTLQQFIKRIDNLRTDAEGTYYRILKYNPLNTRNENHLRVLIEVVKQFQDYSFVRSHKTDLYQLVFYRFATPFSKDQNAQFVTPLPLIDFLVNIVNPRNGESVIDPTVGIADFLSVSYVNSKSKLDDNNIYGFDIDDQMVMLATLNMLLNGDGNAKILSQPGYGSLLTKFDIQGDKIDLLPDYNKGGKWDERPDNKKLKKFDVVLTNPPFGEDRAFVPKEARDKDVIECYELWKVAGGSSIDLGLVFLENAYRILKDNGRMGIVLSNSIASIDKFHKAREWLLNIMRIVAIFDLPPNVFAETGVNTTLIVAYKPKERELKKLKQQNYKIFFKNIQKVGYEIKTSKRVKYFSPSYKIDLNTFNVQIDKDGRPILDEDFGTITREFKNWCLSQEKSLQDLFIKAK